jgi:hypothetical protein
LNEDAYTLLNKMGPAVKKLDYLSVIRGTLLRLPPQEESVDPQTKGLQPNGAFVAGFSEQYTSELFEVSAQREQMSSPNENPATQVGGLSAD